MGSTVCTEPQCLYKGAFYLYLYPPCTALRAKQCLGGERPATDRTITPQAALAGTLLSETKKPEKKIISSINDLLAAASCLQMHRRLLSTQSTGIIKFSM